MTHPTHPTSTPSTSSTSAGAAVRGPWSREPQWYRARLCALLVQYIERLESTQGITRKELATVRMGWQKPNHLSQITLVKYDTALSPASALQMAQALELDADETDELVILTMRANADRSAKMSAEFLARYEKVIARRLIAGAKRRGVRLS